MIRNRSAGLGSGPSNGNSRLFKWSCFTLLVMMVYNVSVRNSTESPRPESERMMDFSYQNNQEQVPLEMQQNQLRGPPSAPMDGQTQRVQQQEMPGLTEFIDGLEDSPNDSLPENSNVEMKHPSAMENEDDADVYKITRGTATMRVPVGEGMEDRSEPLEFYHCGPTYTLGASDNAGMGMGFGGDEDESLQEAMVIQEIILLHGAKFSMEDWKTSTILEQICHRDPEKDNMHHFSVVALNLPVKSDGMQVARAFDALAVAGITSGMPVTVVSPSASGFGLVDLAKISREAQQSEEEETTVNLLQSIVDGWIPVAAAGVSKADAETLGEFPLARIPVLAVHGSEDSMGIESSKKLESQARAKVKQLGKQHPCYLDEPAEFAATVKEFAMNLGTWFPDE